MPFRVSATDSSMRIEYDELLPDRVPRIQIGDVIELMDATAWQWCGAIEGLEIRQTASRATVAKVLTEAGAECAAQMVASGKWRVVTSGGGA